MRAAIFILIAIAAWPITLAVLFIWVIYKVIRAVYRNYQKNKRQTRINAVVPSRRESLARDRALLVAVMVASIKKHWDTLEDKFEEYVEEDDYGNVFVKKGLKKEFTYFSEKVVLPELQHQIESGKTTNRGVGFILQDTIYVLQRISQDYFGIQFEDSNEVAANKMLSAINESTMDDDLLYSLETNLVIAESYSNQIQYLFTQSPSITLNFSEKLKISEPITVAPFVGLVFTLFSAMHNSKASNVSKELRIIKTFTGNDPYKYEEFIKELLRDEGFDARRTKGSGDYGVDVLASKDGKTYAIQCKLYNHTVGTKAVQEIVSGRIYYKAEFAIVVSDNSFTDAAKMLARRSDVILVHHKNLLHKIESLTVRTSERADHNEPEGISENQSSKDMLAKNEWSQNDSNELITVVLPTVSND